jgi:hypothetical protein
MRRILILVLLATTSQAQSVKVGGRVTFLAGPTVYVSSGRSGGIGDSTTLFDVRGEDTIAVLKVVAVSSKSSASIILRQTKLLTVGDSVAGFVTRKQEAPAASALRTDTSAFAPRPAIRDTSKRRPSDERAFMTLQGRASLQYFGANYDQPSFNLSQPGIVLSMDSRMRDFPVRISFYGNLRTLGRGGVSPISSGASDQSRIYRLSAEVEDATSVVTFGRILPTYAPSIGSIDGISYARKVGTLIAGASVGFQPSYNQQGISTETRKVALYGQYRTQDPFDLTVTGAYARTYVYSLLDREAVSLMVNASTQGGLSIYGYTDVDLRKKNGDQFELAPGVSTTQWMVNYRLFDFVSVGAGVDASRPVYPFSSVQSVADSLLDHTLRSGATFNLNLNIMNGLSAYNTFTPRALDGRFGQDYSNYSAFYLSNVLSTGTTIRMTLTMTNNAYTIARGYGVNLQRNVYGVDITFRFLQSKYDIVRLDERSTSQTLGLDLMAILTNQLSFVSSFDATRGYGPSSFTVFAELTWRF